MRKRTQEFLSTLKTRPNRTTVKSAYVRWILMLSRSRLSQGSTNNLTDDDMKNLERYVILMYDRSSQLTDINECRKILFTRKGRSIDSLPPTRGALQQHAKRALLQGG
eukprot:gene19490-21416_t